MRRYVISVLLIIIILIMTSCSQTKNEYTEFIYNFYDLYFKVAENIETNEVPKTLELLQEEDNQNSIQTMGNLIENISEKVPRNKLDNYEKLNKWYNELVELSDNKYKDWWEISLEERSYAHTTALKIDLRLSDWTDKDSNTAWEW